MISSDLSSVSGITLENDFTLTIYTQSYTHIGAVPNPYYPALFSGDSTNISPFHFIHLPSTCNIIIYDIFGNEINTIYRENELNGFEKWDLTNSEGDDVLSGIYRYEVRSDETTFLNGIIVINR